MRSVGMKAPREISATIRARAAGRVLGAEPTTKRGGVPRIPSANASTLGPITNVTVSDGFSTSRSGAPEGYKRHFLMTDTHLGHEDRKLLELLRRFVADNWWDGWHHLGDLLDCESISRFNDGKPRKIANSATLKEEFALGNKFLDEHLEAARSKNPECEATLVSGNHEDRTEALVDRQPQLAGLVEVEPNLELKRRKVRYVPYWSTGEMLKIGKAYLCHGHRINQYHAAAMVRDYGATVLYGHSHDVQDFPVKRLSDKSIIAGQSLGCTCDLNPPWIKGRPQNWCHAFGVLNVFPDNNFALMVVKIFKHRFVSPIDGRVYS